MMRGKGWWKGFRAPVMLAPMAGVTDVGLVAAGAKSGILALHGASFRSVEQLRNDIEGIRAVTDEPFGINLFVNDDDPRDFGRNGKHRCLSTEAYARTKRALAHLEPMFEKYGSQAPDIDTLADDENVLVSTQERRHAKLQVVLDLKVKYFSFCFGCLDAESIKELQNNGTVVIGTATSVAEAVHLAESGVDGVVAQGSDAGGHRGSFLPETTLVGTMSLVPQVVDAVGSSVPVFAAGGIMDARGVKAALCLGAQGAAMGTAFITCIDSSASDVYKQTLVETSETGTVVTPFFSGRAARGVDNEMAQAYQNNAAPLSNQVLKTHPDVAPYPLQQILTTPLKQLGHKEHMSMWCGQGVGQINESALQKSVEDVVQSIVKAL